MYYFGILLLDLGGHNHKNCKLSLILRRTLGSQTAVSFFEANIEENLAFLFCLNKQKHLHCKKEPSSLLFKIAT